MNRRNFLRTTAAASAAPLFVPSSAFGANDRISLGFIGLGGRAKWLIKNEEFPGTQITAFTDCFLPRCDEAAAIKPSLANAAKYTDYRQMFDKQKLDAVFIETTTHARVLIAIHALQAGLDVYAEKPVSLTIAEGRTLVNAVRKYNRVLQAGTQQRSMPINRFASKLVRDGALGKIQTVIACNFEPPQIWQPQPEQPIPAGLDWDKWCNQTPLRPYHKDLQTKWGWWRDYDGGGQSWGVTGWGTHALDQVQCALGADDTGPVELWPEEEGPQCRVTLRYAGGTLLKLQEPKKNNHDQLGAIFTGEKGTIQILRGNFLAIPEELKKGAPEVLPEGPGEVRYHIENFLESIRTRKKPLADVETAHRATTVCHLINICRELKRKVRWDPVAEKFTGDEEANRLLSRPRRKGYELPAIS